MRKPIDAQPLPPPPAAPPEESQPVGAAQTLEPPQGQSPAGSDDADAKPPASSTDVNSGSSLEASAASTVPAGTNANGTAGAVASPTEHGSKKSVAYQHTAFHRLTSDASGKEFERRMCRYCDAIFSFKGGTTSAALRHLKTSHPERLLFPCIDLPGLAVASPAPSSPPSEPQTLTLAQRQQRQRQLEQRQLEQLQRQLVQQQRQLARQHQLAMARSALIERRRQQQQQRQLSGDGDAASVDQVAAEVVPAVVADALDSGDSAATATDEDATYYAQKERELRTILKRKRESGSFDVDVASRASPPRPSLPAVADAAPPPPSSIKAEESAAEGASAVATTAQQSVAVEPPVSAAAPHDEPAQRLTASQEAIAHFLKHHKDALSVSARLQFARHLTRNVADAEMYNVLDDETRALFVREFADGATDDHGGRKSTL